MNESTSEASATVLIQPAPEASPSVLEKLWRVLIHPLLLGILAALAAGVMAAHVWLPQLPSALVNDPVAATAWLDETAASVAGGGVFRALGLFDLAHNLALRVLLPLLAAILLLHLASGVLRAWRVRRLAPPTRWLPGFMSWDATLSSQLDETAWHDACTAICSSSRISREDSAGICDCHHRVQWLGLAWELGLFVALTALLLNLYSGWQVDPIVLDPGQSASLAPYAMKDVSLSEDAARISLCCPEVSALVADGGVGEQGVQVIVAATGQAAQVALLKDGHPLQLQAIEENARVARQLVVHFPETRSERAIAAPEANLAFRLVALDDGGVRVQILDASNQTLFSQDVHEASALSVGEGLTLQIVPTSYVVLRAQGRPWTWLLWPAALLMLIGFFVRWRWPYWRLGMRSNESGVAFRWQGPSQTRSRFERFLERISSPENREIRKPIDR